MYFSASHCCDRLSRRHLRLLIRFLIPSLLFPVRGTSASSMTLQLSSKSKPFCNGALSLESLKVACEGSNGECYFGTNIRVSGSILANEKLTTSATMGVSAYIDGLVNRDLGYKSYIDLCNYVTSTYDDEACPSTGSYQFDISYTIPYLDDSAGWWFGYNNKIGVNVDVIDSATDGAQFAATCHMMLVVASLDDNYNTSSSTQTQRMLYWSMVGFAVMTGGFWIGYSVRRKCRVVCLEDLNRIVACDDDRDDTVQESPPHVKPGNDQDEEVIVHAAAFEIMNDHPMGPVVSVPATTFNYLQPPNRQTPLLTPLDHMTHIGIHVQSC